jgi:hypothetical protein
MRFDLYGRTQSEPKQGFCFDRIDARERNQPRRLPQEGFGQVLQRPIETTGIIGMWLLGPHRVKFPHSDNAQFIRSWGSQDDT